ncbi:unnamed protein product [Absidia cylindrospora]
MFTTIKSTFSSLFGNTTTTNNNTTTSANNNNTTTSANNNNNNTSANNNNNNNNNTNIARIDQGYEMVYHLEQPWSFHFVDKWDCIDFHFVGGDFLSVGPLPEE